MVGAVGRTGSLFYVALGKQASLIKDDLLEPIDVLLDNSELVDLVRKVLEKRRPRSRDIGRPSIAPDRLLRCCALKHIKGWSFRVLERELRNGLAYRKFTRFNDDAIPDFSVFCRTFGLLGGELLDTIHGIIVTQARAQRVAPGRRMRTDTTVSEANIHYPTDSTLLADGVRVLQRSLERISEQCAGGAVKVVDHARSVKHRVLEIHRAAKSVTTSSRERMTASYRKLVRLTRGVVGQAKAVSKELLSGGLEVVGNARRVVIESMKLDHFVPLVQRVIEQTGARVFNGDRHFAGKLVSLFEEHAQVIRKGKVHKPTEFGRLVRIDQVENGIVSNVAVAAGNPGDSTQWETALQGHQERFGRAPEMATGDRGFYSAANEKTAREMGVKRVALPARGKLSPRRRAHQKQRWFRRALRWRGGIEPAIATLKHRFAMARAFYKGDYGFKRAVGWSVIANNLVMIARFQRRQERKRAAA
jgi:IS5 family transposase